MAILAQGTLLLSLAVLGLSWSPVLAMAIEAQFELMFERNTHRLMASSLLLGVEFRLHQAWNASYF